MMVCASYNELCVHFGESRRYNMLKFLALLFVIFCVSMQVGLAHSETVEYQADELPFDKRRQIFRYGKRFVPKAMYPSRMHDTFTYGDWPLRDW
ncbi:unnamed protein product [Dicrocoelium dendriticum]|nr:unnamed protein product [Dicrocoelium dendriticum]